jgi:hypothetical protein
LLGFEINSFSVIEILVLDFYYLCSLFETKQWLINLKTIKQMKHTFSIFVLAFSLCISTFAFATEPINQNDGQIKTNSSSSVNGHYFATATVGTSLINNLSKVNNYLSNRYSNYTKGFVPSFGAGFEIGYSFFDRLNLVAHFGVDYGFWHYDYNQYKKLEDFTIGFSVGYEFYQTQSYAVEARVGFAGDFSSFFYSRKNTAQDNSQDAFFMYSVSAVNAFVPISLTWWFNMPKGSNKLGFRLQANVITSKGTANFTGLDVDSQTEDARNTALNSFYIGAVYKF